MGIRIAELEIFISDNVPEARKNLQDLNRDLVTLGRTSSTAAQGSEELLGSERQLAGVFNLLGTAIEQFSRALSSASTTTRTQTVAVTEAVVANTELASSTRTVNDAVADLKAFRARVTALEAQQAAMEKLREEQGLFLKGDQAMRDAELRGAQMGASNAEQTRSKQEQAAATQRLINEEKQLKAEEADRLTLQREAVSTGKQLLEQASQKRGLATTQQQINDEKQLRATEAEQLVFLREALGAGRQLLDQTTQRRRAAQELMETEIQATGQTLAMQEAYDRAQQRRGGGGGGGGGGGPPNGPNGPFNLQGSGGFFGVGGAGGSQFGLAIGGPGGIAASLGLGVLTSAMGALASTVGGIVNLAVSGAQQLVSGAVGVIGGFFSSIGQAASGAIASVAGFFGEIVKGALSMAAAYLGFKALEKIIGDLSETIVGFSADVERNSKAWAAMLHSVELADDTMFAIQKTAVATSYSFDQVERGVRQLIQGGFSLGQVLGEGGLLKDVQDVASSMGSHMLISFDHLSLALGQVKQAGHLTGEEMRQLRNAGVSIPEVFATMSEQTGKTTGELMRLQREGKVTSEMFLTAFHSWAQANFGNLAEAQAKSLSGAFEQIRESLTLLGSRAFQPLFERISATAQAIAKFVTGDEGTKWAARFAAALDVVLDGLGTLVGGFQEGFQSILHIVTGIGHLIYEGLQWLNPFARHSPSLVESVEEGVARIRDAYANLGQELPAILAPAADAMLRFRESVAPGLERIDAALFAEQAKDLALIGPGAPAAFREATAGIKDLREEAAGLSPGITEQKQLVFDLTAEFRKWDLAVKTTTATLKEQEQALKPYDDQLAKIKQSILSVDVAIAEAEREHRQLTATLQPLKDAFRDASDAVDSADLRLKAAQITLREGQQGLRQYREALADASEYVSTLQDRLSSSRDVLAGVNDQLSAAKDNLKDVLTTPLQGTAEFREKIGLAKAAVAELNAQYLTMKAGGASDQALKGEQRLLESARARLAALQAQQEVRITLPEERLRDLASGGMKEIAYDVKLQGVATAQAQLSPLEAQAQAAEGRVRQDTGALHAAQQIVTARKDELLTQERLLAPRQHAVDLAQREKTEAELVRDAAKTTLELEEKRVLGPIANILAGLREQRTELTEQQKMTELARAQKSEEFQETRDQLEYEKTQRDDWATARDEAKRDLDEMVAAQSALVQLAGQWQSEVTAAASQAKSMAAELAREEAERKRREKEDTMGEGIGPANRTAGAEQLAKFHAERAKLKAEFEQTKGEFAGWLGSLNDSLNETSPWLSAFFGRLRGFASGTADALEHVFNHDVPGAIATFKGTLQDVGDGLPAQLRIWGTAFEEWVQPAATQLVANLVELGKSVGGFIDGRVPVYEKALGSWVQEFTTWASRVWTPLAKLFEEQLMKPFSDWIGAKAKDLSEWVLKNWVTPFWKWVLEDENGAWAKLRPQLVAFIWKVNEFFTQPADESDPLYQAGTALANTLKKGFMDMVGTVAHEMWSALMDAFGRWVNENKATIVLTLYNPMLALGLAIGQAMGPSIAKGIVEAIGETFNRLGSAIGGDATRALQADLAAREAANQAAARGRVGQTLSVPMPAPKIIQGLEEAAFDDTGERKAQDFYEGFEDKLEISSPSKVFARIGAQAAQGFAQGMAGQLGQVQNIGQQYANAFTEGGKAYFSVQAGQQVRTGFSLQRNTAADQAKSAALEEARAAAEAALAAAAAKSRPTAIDPGKEAMFGGQSSPGYVPQQFLQAPSGEFGPPLTGDRAPRSFSYDEGGNPDNVTLTFINNGVLVGEDGINQVYSGAASFLARDARLRKLMP